MDAQERTAEKMMFDDDGELVFAGPPKKPKEPRITLSFKPGDIIYAEKFVAHLRSFGIGVKASYQEANGAQTYILDGNYAGNCKCQDECEDTDNTVHGGITRYLGGRYA